MPEEPQNPIVALAMKIRARQEIDRLAASADRQTEGLGALDAAAQLAAFAAGLQAGAQRLNAILGRSNGVTFVRLEKPLRLRLRFREQRIALDLDEARQLVTISGGGFDGEYQFAGSEVPALINLSKLSTEEGYGEAITPSLLLKNVAKEAELPRPAHLDEGPLQF